jgi:IS30 family transposase
MRSYHHLTEGERNQIYALKKAGLTQCAIAEQINGHLKDNDQPSVSPEWI